MVEISDSKDQKVYIQGWNSGNYVNLVYRDKDGKHVESFKVDWYFCVSEEDYHSVPPAFWDELKKKRLVYRYEVDDRPGYVRIYCQNKPKYKFSTEVNKKEVLLGILEEAGIKPLEADLRNLQKYCIENHVQIAREYKTAYFDIETDDTNREIQIGGSRVVSAGFVDQEGKETWFCEDSERELLQKIADEIRKYDVIVTWNGDKFDVPYLEARFAKKGIQFNFYKEVTHIDLMQLYIPHFRRMSLPSFKLDFISKHFLGVEEGGKYKRGQVIDMFNNDRKSLRRYNLRDCDLLRKLEEKLDVIGSLLSRCLLSGVFLNRATTHELLDMYVLRKTTNVRFPSRSEAYDPDFKYQGGYVVDPIVGLHDNVVILDFKSLYPSIIRTFNVSIDVMRESDDGNCIKSVAGAYFSKARKGIVPKIVDELVSKRDEIKYELPNMDPESVEYKQAYARQYALKTMANSFYGILGYQRSRYFSRKAAESITLGGQFLIKETKKFWENLGFVVVYGDTDSTFVKVEDTSNDVIEEHLKNFHAHVSEVLKEKFNIDKHYIVLENEKMFKRFLLLSKKRYFGHLTDLNKDGTPKTYGRGLDYVKKDTLRYTKRLQKELLVKMTGENPPNVHEALDWLIWQRKKFLHLKPAGEDLAIRTRITKRLDQYSSKGPHVRIAERLKETDPGQFWVGMNIAYIVTDGSTKGKSIEGVSLDDYDGQYDAFYYWNHRIYPALERVLEVSFPRTNWKKWYLKKKCQADKKQSTLENFV